MLFTQTVGDTPPRFVFLHGLFGRGRNWATAARALAARGLGSLLVDLPDHGRSDWSERFDYRQYADDVAATMARADGGPVVLVGHSLGGKVAMLVALRHPGLVAGLAVVDIAPVPSVTINGFDTFVAAMRGLDLATLTSRTQADALLAASIPDASVRGLLGQNLASGPWRWQPNLELLGDSLEAIAGWPPVEGTYDGPVLWLVGDRSGYTSDADFAAMRALFPAVARQVVPDAGHWVHADQPDAVIGALERFDAQCPTA